MLDFLKKTPRRIRNWVTGPLLEETVSKVVVDKVLGDTLSGEIRTQVKRGAKLLQLAFFPDLSLDDESGMERTKDTLEQEMRDAGFTPAEASLIMSDFDSFLENDLKAWQSKILRYTVMSQEGLEGRLAVLRRFFTLNPDDPGSLTISKDRRLQIMRNIASEEPIMMMLGRNLRESAPKAWKLAKKLGLNTPQFGTYVYLGAVSGVESAWHFYLTVVDPAGKRIAAQIELWDLRQSKARRARHGLI